MNIRAQSFDLDGDSFRAIADLVYRESGLILTEEKSSMVRSRLRHRVRHLQLEGFAAYSKFLMSEPGQPERRHLISALTTNVSHFFREAHHFSALAELFDQRLPRLRRGGKMRIWSAGCANGQEAISAAITLLERYERVSDMDLRILATDIDATVVRFARRGVYPERLMSGVRPEVRAKYFEPAHQDGSEPAFAVVPAVRQMIRFHELNLLGSWPMRKKFDAIFCRNVVIYFDASTQEKLWPRLHDALEPDGALFLGHSERITDPERFGFTSSGPTMYRPRAA